MSALMTVTATSKSTMAMPSPFTRRARVRDALAISCCSWRMLSMPEARPLQPLLMLFEDAFDLLTLSFHLRAQPTALDLNLAETAIERGKIRPLLQRSLPNSYTGEHGQQLRRIG